VNQLRTRGLCLLAAALCASALTGAQPPSPWADVEHTITQPVQVKPIKKWTKDGAELESFRFNSHQWDGKWIWAYAIYGKPKGDGPFPAILHIHGGGQTASEANVLDWTRQGYAVMTFDWTGAGGRAKRPAEIITPLPPGVASPRTDKPTIRHSKVWHAVLIARRALTQLVSRPEVDAGRVGSYGISWGGYTMWLVNGVDRRLKAACAIYGCGIVAAREESAKNIGQEWRDAFEPIHYASRQGAPILYLGATNDFFGWVPTYAAVAAEAPVEQRSAWTVNEDHHIAPAAATAYRWMDCHVRGGPPMPPEPTIQLKAEDNRLVAHMIAPQAATVAVIFSVGEANSPQRLWHRRSGQKRGEIWRVELPVPDPGAPIWAMAEATYPKGYYLNSRPAFAVPIEIGQVAAAPAGSRVLYDPNVDGDTITRSSGTELFSDRYRARIVDGGPHGGKCALVESADKTARGCRALFRHVSDPLRAGREGEALAMWISPGSAPVVTVVATVKRRGKPFVARMPLKRGGPEWQRVVVKREQLVRSLKEGTKQALPSWSPMQSLALAFPYDPASPPRIGRLEWVAERAR